MTRSLLVQRDGGVVTLTLNRPDSLNSLNRELREALRDELAELDADTGCRALVLAGAGRAFCVGQDLREHATAIRADPDPLRAALEQYNQLALRLAGMGKPVVAAVRGAAAGAGASLALLADFRVGGPSSTFVTAFAGIGLAADTGLSWILPRLVGHAKATEMLLLPDPVPADEAVRIGLLTQLAEADEQVLPAAQALARRLAAGPTVAYGAMKRELLVASAGSLADALAAEAQAQRVTGATTDHREATEAFLAKRRPTFGGS
ncbi:MAG: enoyl-CoA hydratase/isomerase family protein [Micromonosporaceae bacterium]|nr:enoyl-CoA hydratase/isomerase family protein [Micromonosporaceae bacterium]